MKNRSIDYVSFGTTENIEAQVEVVDGSLPAPAEPVADSVIDVMIHQDFASDYGIQAGEFYSGYNWRLDANDPMQITTVRIAGIWRPLDEDSEYWFYRPNVFEDILLVNEETFRSRLAPYTESEVNLAVWYLVTDGGNVNTSRGRRADPPPQRYRKDRRSILARHLHSSLAGGGAAALSPRPSLS